MVLPNNPPLGAAEELVAAGCCVLAAGAPKLNVEIAGVAVEVVVVGAAPNNGFEEIVVEPKRPPVGAAA